MSLHVSLLAISNLNFTRRVNRALHILGLAGLDIVKRTKEIAVDLTKISPYTCTLWLFNHLQAPQSLLKTELIQGAIKGIVR